MIRNPFEAIVIGSGATGGIAALTLAEQGIRVLVIEAGPALTAEQQSQNNAATHKWRYDWNESSGAGDLSDEKA